MSIIDILKLNEKDPRWLELEICREFQRQKCPRLESECKFSHVPSHVSVTEGRVTACYDSIRGRCHRKQPACKYFHPPAHLAQQLLVNGRKYLELKNLILGQVMAAAQQQQVPPTGYMGAGAGVGYVQGPYVVPRPVSVPVTMPNLGVPPSYVYPPPTIIPATKSPQLNPITTCETIPYPGMFLYKKSVQYKPAIYAPTLYTPGPVTTVSPDLGIDLAHVAKGVYGQRMKKF